MKELTLVQIGGMGDRRGGRGGNRTLIMMHLKLSLLLMIDGWKGEEEVGTTTTSTTSSGRLVMQDPVSCVS